MKTTRRDIIKGGIAATSLFLGGGGISVSYGSVHKSMLGAKGMMASSNGWTNPYVTDGLIAMWDAEWNAGGGVHSSERIITNLATGDSVSIPESGYEIGDNYIISDAGKSFILGDLTGVIDTPCTLYSVGCCMTKPTSTSNTSGVFIVEGIGGLFMWRRDNGASGIVGGSLYQTDGKIHYYGAPYPNATALSEVDAETFGVLRSRAAVIPTRASASGLTYYCDGVAKSGTNTMSWKDLWSAGNKNVLSPQAVSCRVKWCNVSIYSRALTASEIAANYAVDKQRFNLP